jgi:hypothetical protein
MKRINIKWKAKWNQMKWSKNGMEWKMKRRLKWNEKWNEMKNGMKGNEIKEEMKLNGKWNKNETE